tara:strand:+ start:946 stop:3015 length:2070 start_codon:yes stop_codon:yes gene_type:complete
MTEVKRLQFDSQGRPKEIDGQLLDFDKNQNAFSNTNQVLKTSDSLSFLKEDETKLENIFENKHWSLYQNDKPLSPLKFSNNKTQEDIVREIVELIKTGKKVILLHGVCGTGKSAIALNISRVLGKASIVVPIKSLQKQYEEDYMGEKYLLKPNGKKLKIAMITGRDNHDSIIVPGVSCADPNLPDTIKLTEKNYPKLKEYYLENPFISNTAVPEPKDMRRISIAPTNPYWSPILPATVELNNLKDAKKRKYIGMYGDEFVFYHRKPGCSYYDQYLSYFDSDVIIFNSAKYLTEISMRRKPQTDVEIIDEADEFLDGLSNQIKLNLTRLASALRLIVPDSSSAKDSIKKILDLLELEERNKKALGIATDKIYQINETKLAEILKIFSSDIELGSEITIDETNYANQALEAAKNFIDSIEDTYVSYNKEDDFLYATLVTTDLAKKFKSIVDGSNAMILMSGTLHSKEVMKHIFGIEDYSVVEAETLNQGSIEISRTGTEFDCKYSNFQSERFSRGDYLMSLDKIVKKSKRPTLIHVNAFKDLPSSSEIFEFGLTDLISQENLRDLQYEDKIGERILKFKSGNSNILFTTKCSRGIDFPGETCNSVIFTKYPNPNIQGTFWKILNKTHPNHFWEFYKDKARREFLQRIYRALRSKDDHVCILSPDIRVLNAVRELQLKADKLFDLKNYSLIL